MPSGKSNKPDPKEWREFEKTAARIERLLAPQGFTMKSPDHIQDVETGDMREVDASFRHQVGSVRILIIMECRRRGKSQDVQWIEQLATKQRSIRANKCIAVSSKGFSKQARVKAEKHGIDMRLMQDLINEEILKWLEQVSISVTSVNVKLYGINIMFETDGFIEGLELADDLKAALMEHTLDAPILFCRDISQWITLEYIIEDWQRQGGILEDASVPIGQTHRREIHVQPVPFFYTRTNKGQINVSAVAIMLDITVSKNDIPLKERLQYSNEATPIAYVAQGPIMIDGHDCGRVVLMRSPDAGIGKRLMIIPNDPDLLGRGVKLPPPVAPSSDIPTQNEGK